MDGLFLGVLIQKNPQSIENKLSVEIRITHGVDSRFPAFRVDLDDGAQAVRGLLGFLFITHAGSPRGVDRRLPQERRLGCDDCV